LAPDCLQEIFAGLFHKMPLKGFIFHFSKAFSSICHPFNAEDLLEKEI
jgi:hypothetical protein